MEGIDYSYGSGITAAQVKGYGKHFVCRYLSGGTSKDISSAERASYQNAGIAVVLVWETTAGRMKAGNAAGRADAQKASAQASKVGCPGIPIYFACDYDAPAGDQPALNAYMDGVIAVIGKQRAGAYGSYYVIKRLFDAGKITYGWQTYAWSGGQWDGRAHLQQYKNNTRLGPAQVDLNRSTKNDFGQWPRPSGGAQPPPAQQQPPATTGGVPALHVDYFSRAHNPRCADVRTWQSKMSGRGWKISVDGIFGPQSDSICRSFQREKHLAVDGKVGPKTWAATWTAPVT